MSLEKSEGKERDNVCGNFMILNVLGWV